jgi:hypothetical protein
MVLGVQQLEYVHSFRWYWGYSNWSMHIASPAIGHHNTGNGMEYILYCIQKFCVISVIEQGNLMAWLYFDIYQVVKVRCTRAVAHHLLWHTVTVEGGVWQHSIITCAQCTTANGRHMQVYMVIGSAMASWPHIL